MIWKIILVFLCAMALIGMVGKIMFPDARMLRGRAAKQGICSKCRRALPARGPCDCQRGAR